MNKLQWLLLLASSKDLMNAYIFKTFSQFIRNWRSIFLVICILSLQYTTQIATTWTAPCDTAAILIHFCYWQLFIADWKFPSNMPVPKWMQMYSSLSHADQLDPLSLMNSHGFLIFLVSTNPYFCWFDFLTTLAKN